MTGDILAKMKASLGWAWDDMDGEAAEPMATQPEVQEGTILEQEYGADYFGVAHHFDPASGWSVWVDVQPQWPLNNRSRVTLKRHKPGHATEVLKTWVPQHKGIACSMTKEGKNVSILVSTHSTNKADIQPDFSRPIYKEKLVVADVFPA